MSFHGPLFIVGLSRSGTTLLRNLLNGHSRIRLLPAEGDFIPLLAGRFGTVPDFSRPESRDALVRMLKDTLFFRHMTGREGVAWDEAAFRSILSSNDWETILRHLFRELSGDRTGDRIWGEKSPGYLAHLPLLKEIFPEARFIHIIRDPRDRVLSVRNRWRKSLSRPADEWRRMLELSRDYLSRFGGHYMEIRYEALLADPESVLRGICDFLEVEFEPGMVRLRHPVRGHGEADGQHHIVPDNFDKFRDRLSERQIRTIEERTLPMMRALGYEPLAARRYRPLGPVARQLLAVHDRVRHLAFNVKEYGLTAGLKRGWIIAKHRLQQSAVRPGRRR